jgi:hypothetical protein
MSNWSQLEARYKGTGFWSFCLPVRFSRQPVESFKQRKGSVVMQARERRVDVTRVGGT